MRGIREREQYHRVYPRWAASLPWFRLQLNKTLRDRDQQKNFPSFSYSIKCNAIYFQVMHKASSFLPKARFFNGLNSPGPPAGDSCLILRANAKKIRPTAYRGKCFTLSVKIGNVLFISVLSPGKKEVGRVRKL